MFNGDALDQLEALADAFERPVGGDNLARSFAALDVLTAKITSAAGAFDAEGLWAIEGRRSMHAWLRQRAGRGDGGAGHTVKIARRLRQLPAVEHAWEHGVLSSAQIDLIVANITDRTLPLFTQLEAEMVAKLAGLGARDTFDQMRKFAIWADALLGPDGSNGGGKSEPERQLFLSSTLGGRGEVKGNLDAESTDVARTALRLAERKDDPDEQRSPSERRADALVAILRHYLDNHSSETGGRNRPHLNVITYADSHKTEGGVNLKGDIRYTPETVEQLFCDSFVHEITIDDQTGCVLDFGTMTRTFSPALWTSLLITYGNKCFFPDCDETPREGHHVVPYPQGPTNIANCRPGCWHHHHLVHLPGWTQKLLPDGTLETHAPDGRLYITPPPRAGPDTAQS